VSVGGVKAGLPAVARATARESAAGLRAEAPERSEWREGGSNSVVESQPSKLLVAGSIPVSRSKNSRPVTVHSQELTCQIRNYELSTINCQLLTDFQPM
jgi:hypothetical protein